MPKRNPYPELKFEKKNGALQKLPSYAGIRKRPIPHAAAASPYAGAHVPKIVYVSTSTPFMSAAKRVQKLLQHAEKRALSKIALGSKKRSSENENLEHLMEGTKALRKEEVFIKATGRAIEKAMNIGKWFEAKDEYAISVKTGSVLVVDDIVEDEDKKQRLQEKEASGIESEAQVMVTEPKTFKDKDIALSSSSKASSKKWKQRAKATMADGAELPESRTRWVNTVEIAVTLK